MMILTSPSGFVSMAGVSHSNTKTEEGYAKVGVFNDNMEAKGWVNKRMNEKASMELLNKLGDKCGK